jgi:hypothetical protein
MEEIGVYTTIAISLLGVAYPILLQVISTLDEKYSSIKVVELFDKERPKKWFLYLLIGSLLAVLIWSFKLEPLIKVGALQPLIDNSAALLVIISAVSLVVTFFRLVERVFTYLTPIKFVTYLIMRHNRRTDGLEHFKALSDVFIHSIQKQNHNLSQTISRFLYDDFKREREKFGGAPVEYPDAYYLIVYQSIEDLAILKDKKNSALEYRTAGGIWLLGEIHGHAISEKTYAWLWRNLLLAIKYEQDDMIMYHWERAHQYATFALRHVQPIYTAGTFEISNQQEVDKRRKERKRFFEFHFALGGLLTYKRRYQLLTRMFSYTTSEPPRYELLPESMIEIFSWYAKFRDPYDSELSWISHRYPFPEMEGIRSDSLIVKWISAYISILFLRQYTIFPYLITMAPLAYPDSPTRQSEKRKWIDGLDFFKKLVVDNLDNQILITTLGYAFITRAWCTSETKPYPLDLIDSFKAKLEADYEHAAVETELSPEKVAQFVTASKEIIETALDEFRFIQGVPTSTEETNKWFIDGLRTVQSKDSFAEQPEVHHIDFDKFLAFELARKIREGIGSTFLYVKNETYLLKGEDLFAAIDKLGLSNNEYLAITFGLDISDYIAHRHVAGLNAEDYNGLKIVSLPGSYLVRDSLFILKKCDLPIISTVELDEATRTKYPLQPLGLQYKIYASVLDLNAVSDEIRAEVQGHNADMEIRKSVLMNLPLKIEVSWKKSATIIQMIEFSEYREVGTPHSLASVKAVE